MALYRWPTDPKGKAASHTKTWEAHQATLASKKPTTAAPDPADTPGAPQGELLIPPDPIYDDEVGGYTRRRDKTIAGIGQDRTAGLLDYGFTEDATTGALAFDPNNPFSKAALLKKNFDISRRGTGQTMGSGGQLYAGAYQNAQDLVNRNQLGEEDALQKSLTSWLSENTRAKEQAGTDWEIDTGGAKGRSADRALNNPLYSPTAAKPAIPVAGVNGVPAPVKGNQVPLGGNVIVAGRGVRPDRNTRVKKTRKGRTVTYSTSVKGP